MLTVHELERPPAAFLAAAVEGADFYGAYQDAGIPEFRFGYLEVRRAGVAVSVLPYFLTHFALNTMLGDGALKSALGWLKLPVLCVGHPAMDVGAIDGEISAEVLAAANRILGRKSALLAYKGFGESLPLPGFVRTRGLPNAILDVPQDYFARLRSERRNNFQRKLKKAAALRIEEHDGLPEHLVGHVFELYLNTLQKASLSFERLTEDYFRNTAAISKYLLAFEGTQLIGFTQLMGKQGKMVFKYVGMDYERGRQYGLYFVLLLKAVDICVRDAYTEMDLGATAYNFKQLLGARLEETCVHFRHRNPLAHWLLGKFRFLLEPSAEDLR